MSERSTKCLLPQSCPSSFVEILRNWASTAPTRVAFTYLAEGEVETSSLTYAGLDRQARSIAVRLQTQELAGERALLLYPSGLDFVAAFCGCLYAGSVPVPAYPPKTGTLSHRLRTILDDARPAVILTSAALARRVESCLRQAGEHGAVRVLVTDELDQAQAGLWQSPSLTGDGLALLQYTSGSTSTPKGVMVTHANLLHNEEMIRRAFGQSEASVVVGWLPLYHDMGLIGNVLQPLYCGARCILMPPTAFLQRPARWLEAVSRYRATTSGGPNFAFELCLRKVGPEQRSQLDLSRWSVAFNGAEPVRAETMAAFAEAFAPCGFRPEAFYPCYGLAEGTLFVAGGRAQEAPVAAAFDAAELERHAAAAAGEGARRTLISCGEAWMGQQIVVVDPETGAACPPERVGEIWVSGLSVAQGYWGKAEETARVFRARLADDADGADGADDAGGASFLRTGDLGFLRHGELFVTGRLKDLIVLRGRNCYPQDIELSSERSHPALRLGSGTAFGIEVDREERLVVVQEIERRREDEAGAAVAAVQRAISEEHEIQAHEVVIVRAGAVPKTSSGKVRRQAAREAYLTGALEALARSLEAPEEAEADAAEGAEGTVLDQLRREVSRLARLDPDAIAAGDRLTSLGLDSLAAVELQHRFETRGLSLSLDELMEQSLGELAARLEALAATPQPVRQSSAGEPDAEPVDATLPSHGQRALWFLARLAPGNAAYNLVGAARVLGEFDRPAFRRACQGLVDRHAALRTTFPVVEGEPRRRVQERMEVAIEEMEVAIEKGTSEDEAALQACLLAAAERPFDLAAGPLFRVTVWSSRGAAEPVVLLAVHHAVCDFWSFSVLARELGALYAFERDPFERQGAALPPPAWQEEDWIARQQRLLAGDRGEALWRYWQQQLGEETPELDLPLDRPRPPLQTYGGACRLLTETALGDTLRGLGRAGEATPFMTLLAGFQALLARITGQEDVRVGSPIAGRSRAETAGVVGYLVNTVVLRASLSRELSFAGLLERVRRTVLAAHAHQDYPLSLLTERLQRERALSQPAQPAPLIRALFVLYDDPPAGPSGLGAAALGQGGLSLEVGGLNLRSVAVRPRAAQFDLSLAAASLGPDLAWAWTYNPDLLDATTVVRFAGFLRSLLEGAASQPAAPLADLPLLGSAERHQLLMEWNDTRSAEIPATLHGLVAARARRCPEAVAVRFEGEDLLYGELDRRANRLANHLRRLGIGPETPVGICVERSLEMVWGLLGILKAGAAYVPLDPGYPRERLAWMLEDSGVDVVLTQRALAAALPAGGRLALCLDSPDWLRGESAADPQVAVLPENLAYVIYTSGSTGRPKAALNTHRAIVNRLLWMQDAYGLTAADRVLQKTPFSFDVSVWEFFWPLLTGARLVVCRPGGHQDPAYLARLIVAEGVTTMHFVPSMLEVFLDEPAAAECRGLRRVVCSGEALSAELQDRFFSRLGAALENLYGPTEAAVDVTAWSCRPEGRPAVPIGRPIANLEIYVLDRELRPAPIGVAGELYLGGVGLGRGYLRRPDLTADRFVPHPASAAPGEVLYKTGDLGRYRVDGAVEFLGRLDGQVKLRGVRIELGEIESALRAHPAVRGAAVLLRTVAGDRRLVAYVVPEAGETPAAGELRRHLAARLPSAMLPAAFVPLAQLPLSPNGKLDRRALPEPGPGSASSDGEPGAGGFRSPLEEIVAGIFARVLGRGEVTAREDFFAAGGHSLLAVRAAALIAQAVGREVPVSALFRDPTPAALAAALGAALAAAGEDGSSPAPPIVRVPRHGEMPLSSAQQRLWFLDHLEPGTALYNCPAAVRLVGDLSLPVLARSLAEVQRRHDILRTVFPLRGDQPVQRVLPAAPPALPLIDLSALPDEARAAEAARQTAAEALRPFDLAQGPLLRSAVLRLEERVHLGLLTLHHIVCDDGSFGILIAELMVLYREIAAGFSPSLPELPVQYADFAAWQVERLRNGELERHLGYWRRRLAGAPARLELPVDRDVDREVDREVAAPSHRGALHRFVLAPALCRALEELSRREGATLFMTLLAALQTLLYRCCGQDDLVLGADIANRARPEIDGLIGFFVNLLPLRGDLRGSPRFRELLQQVREQTLGAYAHQDLPFDKLVELLRPERALGQTPLVRAIFSFRPEPRQSLELPGLEVSVLEVETGLVKRDLTLFLEAREGGLAGTWSYRTDLFDAATIARLSSRFETLLGSVVATPDARLEALAIEPEAARRQQEAQRKSRKESKLSRLMAGSWERDDLEAKERPGGSV